MFEKTTERLDRLKLNRNKLFGYHPAFSQHMSKEQQQVLLCILHKKIFEAYH